MGSTLRNDPILRIVPPWTKLVDAELGVQLCTDELVSVVHRTRISAPSFHRHSPRVVVIHRNDFARRVGCYRNAIPAYCAAIRLPKTYFARELSLFSCPEYLHTSQKSFEYKLDPKKHENKGKQGKSKIVSRKMKSPSIEVRTGNIADATTKIASPFIQDTPKLCRMHQ